MADDAHPDTDADHAGPVPHVPKPARDPIVIEGEAREVPDPPSGEGEPRAAADEPSNADAPAEEKKIEAPEALAHEPEAVPASEPEPAAKFDAKARSGGGLKAVGLGFGGALVGGAIALAGAWLLDTRGTETQSLTARVEALDKAGAGRVDEAKAARAAVEARLAALEANSSKGAPSSALDAIDKRIAKLEAAAIKPETLTALQAQVRAAAETATKALALASTPRDGSAPAAPAPVVAPPAPDPRIAEMATAQAALVDRIAKLEAVLAQPKTETRVAPVEVPKTGGAAAQAIAAIALEQRLRAGEPFAIEFAALTRAGVDGAALAPLKPFAESGAPSSASLAASFAKISAAILAAARPEAEGGVLDKLLDRLRNTVRVHPVGETPGEEPEAVVSRIQAALSRGQIAAAVAAFGKLPEAARKAGGDWVKTASARAGADEAARTLRDAAIGRLDGGKG